MSHLSDIMYNGELTGGNMLTFILIAEATIIILLFYLILSRKKPGEDETIKTLEKINSNLELLSKLISDENYKNRKELSENLNQNMRTLSEMYASNFKQLSDTLELNSKNQTDQLKLFSENLNNLIQSNDRKLSEINETLKSEIRNLQDKNEKKLEEMRITVDEKLQSTLEKRLNESFKLVNDQLESVYKGLGEMNRLASDVGDLKRVLTNVKQRGIFGELQLKNILEDIMTPEQYLENVSIKKGNFVEFAVKIPSKNEEGKNILLPIDSKYPREDYEKILEAQEKADPDALDKAIKALELRIRQEAKDINEKYILPPITTDFAILFLPVEGLFAEVLRIPGLLERIRNEYSVVITGPTTITALLNSLQMGFRTLAIEKKSHEVWKLLGAIKVEFANFTKYLAKTKEKLEQAANNIENAQKKSQKIEKKLKKVQEVSYDDSKKILGLEDENDEMDFLEETEQTD